MPKQKAPLWKRVFRALKQFGEFCGHNEFVAICILFPFLITGLFLYDLFKGFFS